MKCPSCGEGTLRQVRRREIMFNVDLGVFPKLVCDRCKEELVEGEVMKKIEQAAKDKGIWGLGKQTKITKSGNSLAVRIPKKLAEYVGLKEGQSAYIHPEGDKIVIEH